MVKNKSAGSRLFDLFNALLMVVIIFVTVYPMYYVVVCSFSSASGLMGQRGLLLWPKEISVQAYRFVARNPNILTGYRVTILVVALGTVLSVLCTAIGAFLITRKRFAMRKTLTYMMVFTMYFSGGMIPTFLLVFKWLGMGDSLWALILPVLISTYNLLIMKANFQSIPDSLEEAAKIDGANDIVVLFRVVLPLSMPILAVMLLFYGVNYWNSWFPAMMYIRTREKFPLQLILREVLLSNDITGAGVSGKDSYLIGESLKYATIVVATAPILCLYPFIQKYFVKGIMIGAVKG